MGDPTPQLAHMESTEQGTGTFRSPEFTVQGDAIVFVANGWDSREGGLGQSKFVLRLAKDGSVVRESAPPQQDPFAPTSWYVSDLRGRKVYFEAIDNVSGPGFAWVGLSSVVENSLDVPAESSAYRSIPLLGTGTWAVMKATGGGYAVEPYLSSLGQREAGTGQISSPAFTISESPIRLKVRGWDGRPGDLGTNLFELCDASTGKILRKSEPPCSDEPQWIEWDVTELKGRSVKLRLVDTNSDSTFAWMGIDEVDAGKDYHIRFDSAEAMRTWTARVRDPEYCDIGGVPFLAASSSVVAENGSTTIKLGCRVKRLFLLGMTTSLDQGNPTWFTPEVYSLRFFIGDSMGSIKVTYANGAVDTYPLVLGESLWWGHRFTEYPEPFASNAKAAATLRQSLRLYPAGPAPDGRYLASITPRPIAIKSIQVTDTFAKAGTAVIVGVTVEPVPGEKVPNGIALPHGKASADLKSFVQNSSLRRSGSDGAKAAQRLAALREVLYTTDSNFPKRVPVTVPAGYKGPEFKFYGDSYAEVLTNILYANLDDISKRVTEEGMYHTSAKGASSYGGYEGFGTYRDGIGSYYTQSWTRDMGRSLGELAAFGFLDQGKLCADYTLKMARVWEERPELKLNGVTLPRHISRILQVPSTEPGQGCFENDGHGMTALFIYNLWRHLPKRDAWLRERWEDVQGLGDWVLWQLENPTVSGAKGVLRTDSECSGGVGYSVYADVACIEALRALADMADSIGQAEKATQWRSRAHSLHSACKDAYVVDDPKFGKTWTLASSGWPDQSTVMGPIILPPDRTGFLGLTTDPWKAYNEAAYQRQINAHKPFGYFGVAMGYGQGFVTQSALLLDKMQDATKMLQWAAKATYSAAFNPYIVPEGCEVDPTGRFWHRTGDLGNGVQQAEIVKALRVVIGIDDTSTDRLLICPRLPGGWTGIDVGRYPVLISRDSELQTAHVGYTLRRAFASMDMNMSSDVPLGTIDVRLGPLSGPANAVYVTVNGKTTSASVERSGDSSWVAFTIPAGLTKANIRLTQAPK